MNRDRYKIYNNKYPYFVTITIIQWLPILGIKKIRDIVVDSIKYLQRNKKMVLYAYVIMENHMHMVIQVDDVQEIISKFKSFTARQIIDYFKESNHQDILKLLGFFKLQHKKDRDFQLWQEGIHPVQIDSIDKMKQKVEYIHNNPVKKGYVKEPAHWIYSSARNYNNLESELEVRMDW